jgi:hypothetical protein
MRNVVVKPEGFIPNKRVGHGGGNVSNVSSLDSVTVALGTVCATGGILAVGYIDSGGLGTKVPMSSDE